MSFNPIAHDFSLLPDHDPAPGVRFYEMKNYPAVSGVTDYHRLNIYLSQDGDFVTIWYGALEAVLLISLLGDIEPPNYDEPLFRGYIENAQDASIILKSLRLGSYAPNKIEKAEEGRIVCSLLS